VINDEFRRLLFQKTTYSSSEANPAQWFCITFATKSNDAGRWRNSADLAFCQQADRVLAKNALSQSSASQRILTHVNYGYA